LSHYTTRIVVSWRALCNGFAIDDNAKGRTRITLFVGVLFGPFGAQIASVVLAGVGHCLCVFVLVVALMRKVAEKRYLG